MAVRVRMMQRKDEHVEHGHLDVVGFDLLAEILGRAADHQSGDEDGQHDEDEHAVESGADAAEDDLAQLDVEQRNHAAERREGVVPGVDGAAAGVGGDGGEERGIGDAEADFLAFHVAARLQRADLLVDAVQERIAAATRPSKRR